MKPNHPALQQLDGLVPLKQPLSEDALAAAVALLAEQFGLDPTKAAKQIRGSSELAKLVRVMCSVPKPKRRGRGRPRKDNLDEEIALTSRVDPHNRRESSQRQALRAYAEERGITEEAARKRLDRSGVFR